MVTTFHNGPSRFLSFLEKRHFDLAHFEAHFELSFFNLAHLFFKVHFLSLKVLKSVKLYLSCIIETCTIVPYLYQVIYFFVCSIFSSKPKWKNGPSSKTAHVKVGQVTWPIFPFKFLTKVGDIQNIYFIIGWGTCEVSFSAIKSILGQVDLAHFGMR